jgi:hypothetical protein
MIRRRTFALNPVERAMLVFRWRREAITGHLHALIGDDSDKVVNGAGKIFYVVLGACAAHAADLDLDSADLRILRGAVNALHEQAEVPQIAEERRAAILSGLQACERLLPDLSQRALSEAALDLEIRLQLGDVRFSDFAVLVHRLSIQGAAHV